MRTPGNDFELAVGFCVTEGSSPTPHDIAEVAYCLDEDGDAGVQRRHVAGARRRSTSSPRRAFVSNASCGLCGKTTLDELEVACAPIVGRPAGRRARCSHRCPIGCARRSGCSTRPAGSTRRRCSRPTASSRCLREDVGRHNALDKVIGYAFLARALPLSDAVLHRVGPPELRDRAEGRGRRHPGDVRGVGAVEPRGRRPPSASARPSSASSATIASTSTRPERVDLDR